MICTFKDPSEARLFHANIQRAPGFLRSVMIDELTTDSEVKVSGRKLMGELLKAFHGTAESTKTANKVNDLLAEYARILLVAVTDRRFETAYQEAGAWLDKQLGLTQVFTEERPLEQIHAMVSRCVAEGR